MSNHSNLIERRKKSIPRGLFHISSYAMSKGFGAALQDIDGKEYIDFASGVGVLNAGHAPRAVVDAIKEQAENYLHSCFNLMIYEPYVRLAERLNDIMPAKEPVKTFLVNSGAEAVEHAVKLARHYTGRPELITFHYAYHGRTVLTTTMTGRVRSYRVGFGQGASGVNRAPYPYCYRCPAGKESGSCNLECFRMFLDLFVHTVPQGNVAAVVMEPVLGEGGVVIPPVEYLRRLETFCQDHGIILIMDEIQSGMGRTGYWTACERFGMKPDMILTAKALASGLPLGAVSGKAEILDSPPPGGIGGTFCGNPVCCAAALATLDTIEEQGLLERARALSPLLMDELRSWMDEFPFIGDVRGLGAWAALELVEDRATRKPAAKLTSKIVKTCHQNGLMTLSAGPFSNVIRLLPPLVISDDELRKGLSILHDSINQVLSNS